MRFLVFLIISLAGSIGFLLAVVTPDAAEEVTPILSVSTHEKPVAPSLVRVESGQASERAAVAIEAPSSEQPIVEAGVIRVLVVDEDAKPLSGMNVGLRRSKNEDEWPFKSPAVSVNGRWQRSFKSTDKNGIVEHAVKEPGEWFIVAGLEFEPGFRFARVELSKTSGAFVQIVLDPLPKDRLVNGVVTDSFGNPIRAFVEYCWTNPADRNERIYVWSNSKTGRFALLPSSNAHDGDLQASLYNSRLRAASAIGVNAGTAGIELIMGPPMFTRIEVFGSDGLPIWNYGLNYQYQLANQWVTSSNRPTVRPNEVYRLGVPVVPFKLSISAENYRQVNLGPLEPGDVGSVIRVDMERQSRITGRVSWEGQPVEGAGVELWNSELNRRWGRSVTTEADGHFEIAHGRPGKFELRAWKDELGGGQFGAFEYDGSGVSDAVIELTRKPATLRGRVFLPSDIAAHEIFLSVSGKGSKDLFSDSTYELPNLPPGPQTIRVLPNSGNDSFEGLIDGYYWESHAPDWPPEWLASESTFEVDLQPGEVRTLDIDLTTQPSCQLNGQFEFGGLLPEESPGYLSQNSDIATLRRLCSSDSISQTPLEKDGAFGLGCREPGKYLLFVEARISKNCRIEITEEIELIAGETYWNAAPEFGALRVLPKSIADFTVPVPYLELRWKVGERRISIKSGSKNKRTGERSFARVPVGNIQILDGREGELLGNVDVIAGQEVVFQMP